MGNGAKDEIEKGMGGWAQKWDQEIETMCRHIKFMSTFHREMEPHGRKELLSEKKKISGEPVVLPIFIFPLSEIPQSERRPGGKTHMELMLLMINKAERQLWFVLLRVKAQHHKDHRADTLFL